MGEQIKSSFLLTPWYQVYSYCSFHLPAIQQLSISTLKKTIMAYIILLHMPLPEES